MDDFILFPKCGWGRRFLVTLVTSSLLLAGTVSDASARHYHRHVAPASHHHRYRPPLHAPPEQLPVAPSAPPASAVVPATTPATPSTTLPTPATATGPLEGYLFEDINSGQISAAEADQPVFNPASNTKVATTFTLLQTFATDYRFVTDVSADGIIDSKGVLQGNLYVNGRYLLFGDDQARELLRLLQKKGIKAVSGNLFVSPDFTMNVTEEGFAASNHLLKILDPFKFVSQTEVRIIHKRHRTIRVVVKSKAPFISFAGNVVTGVPPKTAVTLVQNTSPTLKDLLKLMLCYSNNDMAERFGKMIGGPSAVTKAVVGLGIDASEVSFSSTSGLYVNRLSPRAMMAVVRALRARLEQDHLELSDLLTVSGIDAGTMHKRLNWSPVRGSVISKTGTLPETDNGVTSLSGELHTTKGVFLFVIFEIHGSVGPFRQREDSLVAQFEQTHGGAKAISYTPILPRVNVDGTWK